MAESKLEKDVNDIAEDHREEGESIYDVERGDKSAINDVAEDHREEGESIEDLKRQLEQMRRERDEANAMAMEGATKSRKADTLRDMLREFVGEKGE